jgi:hypothetical protein
MPKSELSGVVFSAEKNFRKRLAILLIFMARILILSVMGSAALADIAFSTGLHTAPIVIPGKQVNPVLRYPLGSYRIFRSSPSGKAEVIPFQIDEVNDDTDYVLDQGTRVTADTGNGIFDGQDELSFMGDDVGPLIEPTQWPTTRPHIVFELRVRNPNGNPMGPPVGAVYVGVFFGNAPPLNPKKYVVFNRKEALVHTSRYRYQFDQKNWLVARKVEVSKTNKQPPEYEPVLDTTTFYLKGDLKYFITVEANHRSIESELEAWKSGPIRSIVRVSFYYKILKLKLELGMYTEISFFSNAMNLPAMLSSPLDGRTSLNPGSGMYYGLALRDNPKDYQIETNMDTYVDGGASTGAKILESGKDFLDKLIGKNTSTGETKGLYWVSMQGKDRSIFVEITPSPDLRKIGLAPTIYRDDKPARDFKSRDNDRVLPLGKSPVNLGIWFDATKIPSGEHMMGFRMFFENVMAPERLAVFKGLGDWKYEVRRI